MENKTPPIEPPPLPEDQLLAVDPPQVGNSKIIIIILLLGLLTLAGVIIYLVKRPALPLVNQLSSPVETAMASPSPTPPAAAPVILDTTNWQTHTDTQAGFSFKYPKSVLLNNDVKNTTQLNLTVAVEKLTDIPEDMPMLLGRNDALQAKARLAQGEGEGLVKIGALNGQTASTYSQFEVCSVMFVRKLTFYPGDYRVMVTLSGPPAKMMADMPAFFHVDQANCGSQMIWNREIDDNFEAALVEQRGSGLPQEWYDIFNTMMTTFQQVTPIPVASPVVSGTVYKNDTYGFSLIYDKPFKLQTSKDDLYGYPHGVALLYAGGQSYDIIIEAWDTQAAYEKAYGPRTSELVIKKINNKFITLLNNNNTPEAKKIIDSFKQL